MLILALPPVVAGGSYGCWYAGQQTVLSFYSSSSLPSLGNGHGYGNGNLNSSGNNQKGKKSVLVTGKGTGSFSYYASGIVTFGCIYGLQSMLFPRTVATKTKTHNLNRGNSSSGSGSGSSSSSSSSSSKEFIPPHKRKLADQFQPPKSMGEAFQRMGRPVFIRSAAAGVSFFFVGVVQTCMNMTLE